MILILFNFSQYIPVIGINRTRNSMAPLQKTEQTEAPNDDFRSLFATHPSPMWVYDPASLHFLYRQRGGGSTLRLSARMNTGA